MQKAKRLQIIERIISEESVSSQDGLLQRLKEEGVECTQATLSRNLRQLGAGRVPDGKGGLKYALPETSKERYTAIGAAQILPAVIDIVDAKGLLVIKTLPGNAGNTAVYIDGAGRYEIAGTIAGDDTILVIPRDGITNQQAHTSLEIILPGLHGKIKK
ncbi:MAG: arginine repressor [Bacteroidales bacterium]|jgi:transcriptional regulator of arginine metabolism